MNIIRLWDMPSKFTFEIPSVSAILKRYRCGNGWADPFANSHSPAEFTNDINQEMPTMYHMDTLEFLQMFQDCQLEGVLLDPPYSMHQSLVSYGVTKSIALTPIYDVVQRIVKPGGFVICFGWNSNGIGECRLFECLEVYLIAHGGHHNDTIITVEQKMAHQHRF